VFALLPTAPPGTDGERAGFTVSTLWNAATGTTPAQWNALGRLFPYLKSEKVFYCPNDNIFSTFTKYDWTLMGSGTLPPGLSAATNIAGSYCLRGYNQPSYPGYMQGNGADPNAASLSDPDAPLGKTLVSLKNHPLVCCNFLWNGPTSYPPLWHQELKKVPVLFADGHVIPMTPPSWVKPGVTRFGPSGGGSPSPFSNCQFWWAYLDIAR
jgi:prepilin-type processing-associated H-X9-DG protein